jgi:hypothetical protein
MARSPRSIDWRLACSSVVAAIRQRIAQQVLSTIEQRRERERNTESRVIETRPKSDDGRIVAVSDEAGLVD